MSLADRILYKLLKIERTYSQTGEDKILKHLFNCFNRENISYLDIGTNHPLMNNNTYLFYRKGNKGVCVEPNPDLSRLIEKYRPNDKCLNVGVGVKEGIAEFYSMSSHTLSTFSKEEAIALDKDKKYTIKEILKIPVKNVNSIIKDNFDKQIDLVSIDVEGWNEEIIKSFDFNSHRPFCFCVETITFSENNTEKKIQGIFEVFEKNNYRVYADTHINTIFLNNDET
jgi:FkbM family methyltransferase